LRAECWIFSDCSPVLPIPGEGKTSLILLTQLNGDRIYVNANLIEAVEGKPDTVISLANGKKLMVRESPDTVVEKFTEFARRVSVPLAPTREEAPWT
jgi:flagellar protein FlbD